jgi:hypothetical protein
MCRFRARFGPQYPWPSRATRGSLLVSMPLIVEGWARPTAIGSIADRDPVAPDQAYQRDVTDREL